MRYTEKAYIEELESFNRNAALRGSIDFAVYGGRNGYTYADHYTVKTDGGLSNVTMIDGGTPRVAMAGARRLDMRTPEKLTRQQSKMITLIAGIDYAQDFHQLPSEQVELLALLAKRSGYRKPRNANGSTARYFFANMQKWNVDTPHKYWGLVG